METKKRKLNKEQKKTLAVIGSMGGCATHRKHGSEYMRELGKRGASVRWPAYKHHK